MNTMKYICENINNFQFSEIIHFFSRKEYCIFYFVLFNTKLDLLKKLGKQTLPRQLDYRFIFLLW